MSKIIIKNQLRSISLPSRSHPSTTCIEKALNKVISTSTKSSSSSDSILMVFADLEELYHCTGEFLKMGSTQRAMSCDELFMEEMLDSSLRLMDICNVSRDLMVESHEHVRNVHSCVRRKKVLTIGGEQVDEAVSSYVGFRKKMRKEAKKLLGSLKKINVVSTSCSSSPKDEHVVAVMDAMRRVVSVSFIVLKSFLEFFSGRQSNIKSKLALVLKTKKKDHHHHEEIKNEFERLDSAICVSCDDGIQSNLEEVEMRIDRFEMYLEGLFRRLIRTRASLLNIISY
ncbi:unnamed protein product [Cochlearia groenlandica]